MKGAKNEKLNQQKPKQRSTKLKQQRREHND